MSGQAATSRTYSNDDSPATAVVCPADRTPFTLREPDEPFGPVIGSGGSEFATETTALAVSSEPDRLVKSTLGVVVGASEGLVSVKLREVDLVVDFPSVLFPDERHVRYGQPVAYEIRERANGYRYQAFVAVEDQDANPYLDEVQALLEQVKLR